MHKFITAATLSLLIGTSALAQTANAGSSAPGLQSNATPIPANKKLKKPAPALYASPYSTNAEHDVYVRGEYVGSDPDPRIRATIRREAVRNYGFR